MKHPRVRGAVIGAIVGTGVGLGAVFYLYGNDPAVGWASRVTAALVVGAVGALLGSLSGVSD